MEEYVHSYVKQILDLIQDLKDKHDYEPGMLEFG
jgi:hypothetical protein